MKVHTLSSIALSIVMLILESPATWAAQSYTIEDLNFDDAIAAAGPNLSGQAAVRSGFVQARSSRKKAGETAENIGLLPGGDHTSANGINDAGDLVGSADKVFGSRLCRPNVPGLIVEVGPGVERPFKAPPSGLCPMTAVRAVIWAKNGGLRDLGTLPGDSGSEAFGINNRGAVVGYSSGPQGARAFLWTQKDGMQSLRTLPGGDFSKALEISDNGLIVGTSGSARGTRAVLWNQGRIEDLGTLPGDTASEAYGVSNSGVVVGYSRGPAGTRAFAWTSKTGMQALGKLPGGNFSMALSLNESEEIVGTSGSSMGTRAVIWGPKGESQDLNTLVAAPAGIVLLEAVGINAKGQILALGGNEKDPRGHHEGSSRVFLLTPGGR